MLFRSGPVHSGAGRIVRIRMRPLSLVERQLGPLPTVSLGAMLRGDQGEVTGRSAIGIEQYTEEILASGLPGLRHLSERARNLQLDGYLDRIIDVEFADQGHAIRRPATLRGWLASYAAATATNASYSKVLDAATPGEDNKPAKLTTMAYRDVLTRLWMLDPVPGWAPTLNIATRLAQAPKHHLADPAFAARLLGATKRGLLSNSVEGVPNIRDGLLLGGLFESLVTQSVQTYAQRNSARVHHLRTGHGDHEIDLIVEGDDRRVVALEVKLAATIDEDDVRHLHWLKRTAPKLVVDVAVVTSGEFAYRRPDGVAVVPAALLGP